MKADLILKLLAIREELTAYAKSIIDGMRYQTYIRTLGKNRLESVIKNGKAEQSFDDQLVGSMVSFVKIMF